MRYELHQWSFNPGSRWMIVSSAMRLDEAAILAQLIEYGRGRVVRVVIGGAVAATREG